MGEQLDQVPQRVREHVRRLVEPAGLSGVENAEELLAQGWLEKHEAFERHTSERGMTVVDSFSRSETTGALVMTYSGSIVSIGPEVDGERDVAYASIGARRDVPQMSVKQDSRLASDVATDAVVEFEEGPVQKTSPVFAIAVFQKALPPAKENAALVEVTQVLTERFVDINNETLHG
ncbi:MAG: hypothetical protein ACOC6J_00215 [Spirochaetota bacterium]